MYLLLHLQMRYVVIVTVLQMRYVVIIGVLWMRLQITMCHPNAILAYLIGHFFHQRKVY